MGTRPAAPAVGFAVHMSGALPMRAPLFPIAGAILFPRAQLPLHIFEPRYREMVRDAVDGDGHIAIIQPQLVEMPDDSDPPLYRVGCVGEIVGLEELEGGRFNIVLNGSNRFRLINEVDLDTAYRNGDLDFGALGHRPGRAVRRLGKAGAAGGRDPGRPRRPAGPADAVPAAEPGQRRASADASIIA